MPKLYRVYLIENGKNELIGNFFSMERIQKKLNISLRAVQKLINGIYTVYQDKWKIETFIFEHYDDIIS